MLLFALVLASCEKVIDLKLDNVAPVIVIEGNISDRFDRHVVKVSKTYNFNEPNRFNSVSGAVVRVTSENGQRFDFTETSPGIYESVRFRGSYLVKYTLNVLIDGKTYTASSVMPEKVDLNSISFRTYSFFGNSNTFIVAHYQDPPGVQNQYRYITKVNDKVGDISVSEDRFDDGNDVSNVLFSDLDNFNSGDKIEVELQCIDRNVFKYFFTIGQATGEDGPPVAPSNPDSNFNNGALGYFSAHTSSIKGTIFK